MFGGLGLKVQPDELAVNNIFEASFTEEVTGAGNAIFERGFNFLSSESRKKLNSISSADSGEIGEQSGSDRGASNHWILMRNNK